MYGDDFGKIIELVADGGELVRTFWGCGVPVVAACTGSAVAAGALILLGCDVRVGADIPAKIGLNEVAIKMVLPDWALTIATDRLSKRHVRGDGDARLTASRGRRRRLPRRGRARRPGTRPGPLAGHRAGRDASTHRRMRGPSARCAGAVLDLMGEQIAADRAAIATL